MSISPTRMELQRLKERIKVAKRGHKLLKDKQDELIKQFVDLVKENKELREKVEEELSEAFGNFVLARAVMSREYVEESLLYPVDKVDMEIETHNIMSVRAPRIKIHQGEKERGRDGESVYPYGFSNTSGELDNAIAILSDILPDLLQLAEIEKTCQLLSDEIEKTRRRVNALEHIMIPELERNIKYITMKLNESERATITRLMKVKELVM